MSHTYILFEPSEDGLVLITINRPEKLNALNQDTIRELDEALKRVEAEAEHRGLILGRREGVCSWSRHQWRDPAAGR